MYLFSIQPPEEVLNHSRTADNRSMQKAFPNYFYKRHMLENFDDLLPSDLYRLHVFENMCVFCQFVLKIYNLHLRIVTWDRMQNYLFYLRNNKTLL